MILDFRVITRLVALVGLLICIYFWDVYKGWVNSSTWLIPRDLCRKNVCAEVLTTKFSRVFIVPNFYLGAAYYLLIMFSTFFTLSMPAYLALVTLSWAVVVFSLYLAYALIFRLRVSCVLCFVAQAVNVAIALLLTFLVKI